MFKHKKLIIGIIVDLALIVLFFYSLERFYSPPNEDMIWGVSFSPEYAQYLGLDTKEVFRSVLDDYKFKYLRLTARWDKVESQRGKFDFTDTDYLMNEAAKRGAKVVLAIGQKTPRWPECNVPAWAPGLSDSEYFSELNIFLQAVTEHYKNNPALEVWQVENEPFLAFGATCRALDDTKLQNEIKVVKNIDSVHPVLVTDSGELSLWRNTAKAGDIFGTTVYRVVWSKFTGYTGYDWMPSFYYRLRAQWYGRNPSTAWVAELQAEPWVATQTVNVGNVNEQFKTMNMDRLQKNLEFAKKTGFGRGYLWGVEWWYCLKVHGYSDISDYMVNLKK